MPAFDGIIGLLISNFQLQQFDTQQRQSLTQFINTVRAGIDSELVNQLPINLVDPQDPNYLYHQSVLTAFSGSFPNIRYLYLMKLINNQVVFLVDTEPSTSKSTEPLALPGEIYESANNSLFRVFSQDKIITVGPEVDKWGSFVSVLAPIKDRQNNIIALIGADIDSTTWRLDAIKSIYPTYIILFIFLFFEYYLIHSFLRYKAHQDIIGYLATVLSSSSDAIVSLSLEGDIKSWNPGAQKIFGYSESEAIGRRLTDLIYPSGHQSEFNQLINKIKLGEKITNHETVRLNKSHQKVTVLITESPIFQLNEIVGASIVYKDITLESQAKGYLTSRNQELEKLNQLMVDREIKMIELKKQVNKLKMKRG
jgi:PAS domain S-box-containing protein